MLISHGCPALVINNHFPFLTISGKSSSVVVSVENGDDNQTTTDTDPDDNDPTEDEVVDVPSREERCSLPQEVGRCYALLNRWFYNTETQQCELFSYGGCYGNQNNFMNEEECAAACGG